MSKAILVMDMPKSCYECELNPCNYYDYYDCPLKPMPQKKPLSEVVPSITYINGKSVDNYVLGWNNCIDELLGETK